MFGHKIRVSLIYSFVVIIAIFTSACQSTYNNPFECPDEIFELVVSYNEAYGTEAAHTYVFFPNVQAKDDYIVNSSEMDAYRIKDIRKVDDKIYEALVLVRTAWHADHMNLQKNEYIAYTLYICSINNEWKIVINEDHLQSAITQQTSNQ